MCDEDYLSTNRCMRSTLTKPTRHTTERRRHEPKATVCAECNEAPRESTRATACAFTKRRANHSGCRNKVAQGQGTEEHAYLTANQPDWPLSSLWETPETDR